MRRSQAPSQIVGTTPAAKRSRIGRYRICLFSWLSMLGCHGLKIKFDADNAGGNGLFYCANKIHFDASKTINTQAELLENKPENLDMEQVENAK